MSDSKSVVLVAEDSVPNRKILVTLLQKVGFQVVETENGQAAWDFLCGNTDFEVQLIVTDVMMPEMSGIELLEKIRNDEKYCQVPVVICSALTDKDSIAKAKELKVNGYLLKPIRAETLARKLKELFPEDGNVTKFSATITKTAA